jgi:hypothetical protein
MKDASENFDLRINKEGYYLEWNKKAEYNKLLFKIKYKMF